MKSEKLVHYRAQAHEFLLNKSRPLPTPLIARHLFGARRHEMPETQVVVRALLGGDPRFVETHDNNWSVVGSSVLRQKLDEATFAVVDLETTGSVIGVDEIIELGFPLFARATCPAGPHKGFRGVIGEPVQCGGVVVNQGDVIVGDADGVTVVPVDRAGEALAALPQLAEREQNWLKRIRAGETTVEILGLE